MTDVAVFVPSPPLLLPQYVGLTDAGAELRARCVSAVAQALGSSTQPAAVLVVTAHVASADPLLEPLGLRVGRYLLGLAGHEGPVDELAVPAEGPLDAAAVAAVGEFRSDGATPRVLLVVGDGSARRGEKAPGHLDERSFALDETVLAALAAADPATLLALQPRLCDELMVSGRAALQAAAYLLRETPMTGEVTWSGDPYGVMYWVARWSAAGGPTTAEDGGRPAR